MLQATVVAPLQDAGDAFQSALANVVAFLPRLLAFLLVIVVGWLIASLLAAGVTTLLRAIRFNELSQRSGLSEFIRNMGIRATAADVIGGIAKWFVRLIALVVAFDALGLPAVSAVLNQLLLWLPNLIVALVVLVVGGLAAGALSRLVRGTATEAGFRNPDLLASITKVTVWSFAVVVAINQLGIATMLINTLLVGLVSAVAIAAGLAFGLGGRDRAAQALERWSAGGGSGGPDQPAIPFGGTANRVWVERSGMDRRRNATHGRRD
jgi:Conserved TM helix